ncbi:hypothetical protein DCO56_11905 [Sphingobacterium athyrii]|uniref:Uncharacterized protein n=1 Tax=Sphingobacterium athyrii TaxID=2152717 RepID=A0A363NTJ9_9SPHI|nr:hypothetical protein DCO56_11905 [Sphingobacterium athyrii]
MNLKLTCNYKIYLILFNGNNTDDFQQYTDGQIYLPRSAHLNLQGQLSLLVFLLIILAFVDLMLYI